MAKTQEFVLYPDKKGVIWDFLLYVPTVLALVLIGLKLWYSNENIWGYVLEFLATFFFLVGANRIATRMQWLPKAPVRILIKPSHISVLLKNGERVDLVKEVKFYTDYAGKSFGLSGMDSNGVKRQFVFHKGQFEAPEHYESVRSALRVFA